MYCLKNDLYRKTVQVIFNYLFSKFLCSLFSLNFKTILVQGDGNLYALPQKTGKKNGDDVSFIHHLLFPCS